MRSGQEVYRLKQLDAWTLYLYLLCFVVHRYQRFNDHLLTCFIQLVKQYADEAKATAKETVYAYRQASNHDLPKAGEVLIAEDEGNTLFGAVQAKAFALLDRQRLSTIKYHFEHRPISMSSLIDKKVT